MILHTVNKSPFSSPCLQECLAVYNDGDTILLIEDGVYAITDKILTSDSIRVYALHADVEARGLNDKLNDSITLIDDDRFVALTIEHDKVVSWY